jgi:ubiquinol-cytochrome c reductase cytochrome c subunit
MKWLIIVALLVAGAVAAGHAQQGQPSSAPTPAVSAKAEEGRKLYISYGCYQCHGYEAQGSSASGPRLGPRPIAYQSFLAYIRRPTGQMPPYTARVASDADIAGIYAFVESRPAPPSVQSLQLLK